MVNRPFEDGKGVETIPVTNFDCLGYIKIECRYYQEQAIIPRLFDPAITPCYGDPITNPYITVTNPSTLSNTISATNVEDNKAGRVSDDVRF